MQRGIAVIPTAPEALRNGDAHYPYRFDSHFHYLTGFDEPEAVLVLLAGRQAARASCFAARRIWNAKSGMASATAPKARKETFGFDAAYPIAQLDDKLTELMGNQPALFHPLGAGMRAWDARLLGIAHPRAGEGAQRHHRAR